MKEKGRRNIQWVAWVVLLSAFALFLIVGIGGPLGARAFLREATAGQEAQVEAKKGTITLDDGSRRDTLSPDDGPRKVTEGWEITAADQVSSAFVRFFDTSSGANVPGSTINLDPFTLLGFEELRRPRFKNGVHPPRVVVYTQSLPAGAGGMTVGTTWGRRDFQIQARGADGQNLGQLRMPPESRARLQFTDRDRFQVVGIQGVVTVSNGIGQVALSPRQRSVVQAGQAPSEPIFGTIDILRNGDFDRALNDRDWIFGSRGPSREGAPLGEAFRTTDPEGRNVMRFVREGAEGSSADLYFRQPLADPTGDQRDGHDIRHAEYIGIEAKLRVREQSLPGGGQAGSEYPLIFRLRSIDLDASSPDGCEWMIGFYSVPPGAGDSQRLENGVKVDANEWATFDTGNLLDPGNPLNFLNRRARCPVPTHLVRFEVGTSGHDFESEVDSVSLRVE